MSILNSDLIHAGFKPSKKPTVNVTPDNERFWSGLWQKRIDVDGTSYSITIEEWDFTSAKIPSPIRREASAQFTDAHGVTFNVEMVMASTHTVDDVLAFFERVRANMGCSDTKAGLAA